jgi:hypothetical protein
MFERIASRTARVPFVRVVLTILAAPFWLIGAAVAAAWFGIVWVCMAFMVGFGDVRGRVKAQDDGAG